ncbi:MAG: hypothetical protein LBK03_03850 [Bacteroidales bacterium]|jgi:hypothetical protein|nr:hypothetical protein [Bacteroidales bacterium]
MKKKVFLLYATFTLLLCYAHAQYFPSLYPFEGFHIGITGQAEFIQKCSYVALSGSDPAPKALWTSGWEAGMEFSYHFAKYLGIVAGISFGTTVSYNSALYYSTVPDGMEGWIEANKYDVPRIKDYEYDIFVPVKLEFHYPVHRDFFFMAEAGAKIKGIFNDYKDEEMRNFRGDSYEEHWKINIGKISCHLLLGLGLYYKLPYGDLLRVTAGVNVSFNNIIEGNYKYLLTDSYGTFAVKNDFIYTQLSYIHIFKYEKAKRYIKREGLSFTSKKERRKKIFALLNGQ